MLARIFASVYLTGFSTLLCSCTSLVEIWALWKYFWPFCRICLDNEFKNYGKPREERGQSPNYFIILTNSERKTTGAEEELNLRSERKNSTRHLPSLLAPITSHPRSKRGYTETLSELKEVGNSLLKKTPKHPLLSKNAVLLKSELYKTSSTLPKPCLEKKPREGDERRGMRSNNIKAFSSMLLKYFLILKHKLFVLTYFFLHDRNNFEN